MNGSLTKTAAGALAAAIGLCGTSWALPAQAAQKKAQPAASGQAQAPAAAVQQQAQAAAAAAPAAQPAQAAPAAPPTAAQNAGQPATAGQAQQNASLGQKIERAVTWPVREATEGFKELERELNGGPHITQAQAQATALKAVPGNIAKYELEKEHGKLLYEFDIQPQGAKKGLIKEVEVNARTGSLISVKTEKSKKAEKD